MDKEQMIEIVLEILEVESWDELSDSGSFGSDGWSSQKTEAYNMLAAIEMALECVGKQYIVEIKTWFDKVNGNSYFSGRVYDLNMKLLHIMPFQYGYDRAGEDTAIALIQSSSEVHEHKHDLWRKCYFNKQEALKRDTVRFGKDFYGELTE